jgi:hypothetical protein
MTITELAEQDFIQGLILVEIADDNRSDEEFFNQN